MDPVLTIIAICFAAGVLGAVLLTPPFAFRVWLAPLLLGAAGCAAQPVRPPGEWDGLAEILLLSFAAAWTGPFLMRGGVLAARAINRRTAPLDLNAGPPPLGDASRRWLRRIDVALCVAVAAILADGQFSAR